MQVVRDHWNDRGHAHVNADDLRREPHLRLAIVGVLLECSGASLDELLGIASPASAKALAGHAALSMLCMNCDTHHDLFAKWRSDVEWFLRLVELLREAGFPIDDRHRALSAAEATVSLIAYAPELIQGPLPELGFVVLNNGNTWTVRFTETEVSING
jgi:hypothetical protein